MLWSTSLKCALSSLHWLVQVKHGMIRMGTWILLTGGTSLSKWLQPSFVFTGTTTGIGDFSTEINITGASEPKTRWNLLLASTISVCLKTFSSDFGGYLHQRVLIFMGQNIGSSSESNWLLWWESLLNLQEDWSGQSLEWRMNSITTMSNIEIFLPFLQSKKRKVERDSLQSPSLQLLMR